MLSIVSVICVEHICVNISMGGRGVQGVVQDVALSLLSYFSHHISVICSGV